MIDKSEFQGIPYSNKNRKSPHGYLISTIFKYFKRFSVSPDTVIINMMRMKGKLLDIGCGDGNFCFRSELNFKRIIGTDVVKSRIRKATQFKKNDKKYKFIVADMDSKFPFKDGYFDTVVMIAAFQYSYDPRFILKEINRVLKKSGELYIQVSNIAWLVYRIQLLFGKQIFTSLAYFQTWDGGILHYFTFSSLSGLIEKSGFKIKSKTCSGLFRAIKLFHPSLLASDIIIQAIKK